ncbi:MAG: MerR family transcriptional regulator [Hydrogenophaga sp.]
MKVEGIQVLAALDETWLNLTDLCHLAGVTEVWVRDRMSDGLLVENTTIAVDAFHFSASDLGRAKRMAQLEQNFDAVPELAALVVDLELELAALRARLWNLKK